MTLGLIGMNLIGGLMQGSAAKDAAYANADTDRRNAALADQASGDALLRGALMEGRSRLQYGQLQGKQTAALAAAGVQTGSGSALDLLADTSMMSELDARTLRVNASREAWGYRTQAASLRRKAQLDEQQGDNALTSSVLGAITQGFAMGSRVIPVGNVGAGTKTASAPVRDGEGF